MKEMQKRNGFCEDINWPKLDEDFCMCLVIVCLVTFIFFCRWQDYVDASNKEYSRACEFNLLSYNQRVIIAEWEEIEVDENYLQTLEAPMDCLLANVLGAIAAVLVPVLTTSTRTLVSLYKMKARNYFLADLPPTKSAGQAFLLGFSFIAGWPFLLVSRIYMRRWEKTQKICVDIQDGQDENAQEAETQHTCTIGGTDDRGESLQAFIEYRQTFNQNYYQGLLTEAEERIQDIEAHLKRAGEHIRNYQSELKTAKQDHIKIQDTLKRLQDRPVDELIADWQAIKKMRGVTRIFTEPSNNSAQSRLCIDITVHVPYKGQVYDFGEYEIQIDDVCTDPDDNWECVVLRDALREDCQANPCRGQDCKYVNGCCADYITENNTFCFGGRADSIGEYFKKGQFRAAIILIIDSLHSVNSPEIAKSIPRCYRPVTQHKRRKS